MVPDPNRVVCCQDKFPIKSKTIKGTFTSIVWRLFLKWELLCRFHEYYKDGICHQYSDWYLWGRWVFAAVFSVVALVLLGCISSHHRRRQGLHPFYGTGWMSRLERQNHNDPVSWNGRHGQGGDSNAQVWKSGGQIENGIPQKPEQSYMPGQ